MRLAGLVYFFAAATAVMAQTPAQLREAERHGDSEAAFQLAEAYRFGMLGLSVRADSSRYFLRRAAVLGLADAQHLYGLAMLSGEIPSGTTTEALTWLEKAAEQAHVPALLSLMRWYGTPPDSASPLGPARPATTYQPSRALVYARRAAALGDAQGASFAGRALFEGRGAPPDTAGALAYLKQAAGGNDFDALLMLGNIYLEGHAAEGVQLETAHGYYLRIATDMKLDIEQRTHGKVGLHNVEQTARWLFNQTAIGLGLPPGANCLVKIRR